MDDFNAKALAQRIRTAREAAGLSRNDLAQKMYLSKSAIDKWEQGRNTPRFPELKSLSKILGVDISYFAQNKKESRSMFLDHLFVVDPNAIRPILYTGVKEILPAWERFYREYDEAVTQDAITDTDTDSAWDERHTFRLFIHRDTKELVALEDFGRYQPTMADVLFCTRYVPLHTHQPETAEALISRATRTLWLFESELLFMTSRLEKPLFLVEYLGTNNYRAWSLSENRFVYVYDYKTYRKEFRVSELTVTSPDEILPNRGYGIIPPSKDLLDAISSYDTDLDPVIWSRKMSWDQWEPRPEKVIRPLQAKQYTDLYVDAVHLINRSRTTDCGSDQEIALLEDRVAQFERLDELGAPDSILDSEAGLVQRSIDTIKTALKER